MFTITKDLVLPATVTGSWPRPRWFDMSLWGRPLTSWRNAQKPARIEKMKHRIRGLGEKARVGRRARRVFSRIRGGSAATRRAARALGGASGADWGVRGRGSDQGGQARA